MAMGDDLLDVIGTWYRAQCDETWEHRWGVTLRSLDNPGWLLRVDLVGTDRAGRTAPEVEQRRSEEQWLVWGADGDRWEGACGPLQLEELLRCFVDWLGREAP